MLYYHQNEYKWKKHSKTPKWVAVEVKEIKKYFALVFLMGQAKKDRINPFVTSGDYSHPTPDVCCILAVTVVTRLLS